MGNGGRFARGGAGEFGANSRPTASLHSSPHHGRLLPVGGGGGTALTSGTTTATTSTNRSHGHLLSTSPGHFADVARESPQKITHGFWMQQYNWLHSRLDESDTNQSVQQQQQQLQASCGFDPAGGEQLARHLTRRQRIWLNLKRTFGGSASDVASSRQQQQEHETSLKQSLTNRWQQQSPAGSGRSRFCSETQQPRAVPGGDSLTRSGGAVAANATTSGGGATGSENVLATEEQSNKSKVKKRGRKNWFSRQIVSKSASNLLSTSGTAASMRATGSSNVSSSMNDGCQQRSHSSCLREKLLSTCMSTTTTEQQQQQQQQNQLILGSQKHKSPSRSSSSSPYRQIARVISRAGGKCRNSRGGCVSDEHKSGSSKVEQRKWQATGKRRRSTTSQRDTKQQENIATSAASSSMASQYITGNEPQPTTAALGDGNQFAPANEQSVAVVAGSSGQASSGGILSSLLASSPLFRRPKKRFASPVAVKGQQLASGVACERENSVVGVEFSDQIKSKQQLEQQQQQRHQYQWQQRQQTQGQQISDATFEVGPCLGSHSEQIREQTIEADVSREKKDNHLETTGTTTTTTTTTDARLMNTEEEFKFQTPATRGARGNSGLERNNANEQQQQHQEEVASGGGLRDDHHDGSGSGSLAETSRQMRQSLGETSTACTIKSKLERTVVVGGSKVGEMMQESREELGAGAGCQDGGNVYEDYSNKDKDKLARMIVKHEGRCDRQPQSFEFLSSGKFELGAEGATCAESAGGAHQVCSFSSLLPPQQSSSTAPITEPRQVASKIHFSPHSPPPPPPQSQEQDQNVGSDGDSKLESVALTAQGKANAYQIQTRIQRGADARKKLKNNRNKDKKSRKSKSNKGSVDGCGSGKSRKRGDGNLENKEDVILTTTTSSEKIQRNDLEKLIQPTPASSSSSSPSSSSQVSKSSTKHSPTSGSSSSSPLASSSFFSSSSSNCFESTTAAAATENANLLSAQLRHSRVSIAIDEVDDVENDNNYNVDDGDEDDIQLEGVSPIPRTDEEEEELTRLSDPNARPASQPNQQPPATPTAVAIISSSGGDISDGAASRGFARMQESTGKQQAPSGSAGMLRDNFKKLVKRQQSVDSYRMARELKRKQKQQTSEGRTKHQSNEAIKHVHDSEGSGSMMISHSQSGSHQVASSPSQLRKFSMRATTNNFSPITSAIGLSRDKLTKIRIDSTGGGGGGQGQASREVKLTLNVNDESEEATRRARDGSVKNANKQTGKPTPTPPNTLSLMTNSQLTAGSAGTEGGHHNTIGGGGTTTTGASAASPYMLATFSGCITPTYLTHHLPSPKYVSPAMAKKYSNASTISSTMGDIRPMGNGSSGGRHRNADTTTATTNPSDTESSIGVGGGSATPSRSVRGIALSAAGTGIAHSPSGGSTLLLHQQQQQQQQQLLQKGDISMEGTNGGRGGVDGLLVTDAEAEAREAAAAARRANLAEHIYDNKCGLGEDMKFLASLPELCDITFLVGETREPVCAVKSVLAARSRVFHKILFGNQRGMRQRIARQQRQQEEDLGSASGFAEPGNESDRRGSSPKQPLGSGGGGGGGSGLAKKMSLVARGSSPLSRSTSPQQQQPGWSVISDASGYNAQVGGEPEVMVTSRSGRVSVVSNGRESVGQSSVGSQQPLIIGPGQTAAPVTNSKRNKKSSIREAATIAMTSASGRDGHQPREKSRLSRMFTKRASDPSIKQQQQQQHQLQQRQLISQKSGDHHGGSRDQSSQSYLDKMSSSQMSTTMIIEEFEPDVFRQLIEYIHTGCVLLQARTLLGLLNAADYYGLEQLRKACLRFVSCCITVDTVCSLLSTAERYIQYKCTKSIVQKVLEFVDTHANEIFKLNAFGLLPEHVVRLILARDGLKADEQVKYNGVYTWCEHYCRSYELTNIADVMQNFLDLIQFHKIPTNVLLSEIYPTHIVPDTIFLSALACQADPQNFEPQPSRQRRMTLPNPMIYKDSYSDNGEDNENDLASIQRDHDQDSRALCRGSVQADVGSTKKQRTEESGRRKSKTGSSRGETDNDNQSPLIGGSREQLVDLARSSSRKGRVAKTSNERDFDGRRTADSWKGSSAGPSSGSVGGVKLRKGSIAHVSISGMKRLSHKLSIRKKSHHQRRDQQHQRNSGQDLSGNQSSYADLQLRRQSVGKQRSLVSSLTGGRIGGASRQSSAQHPSDTDRADPLAVGQQILNAYLVAQRQRELEEEERRRREQMERQAAMEEVKRSSGGPGSGSASADTPSAGAGQAGISGQQSTDSSQHQQSGGQQVNQQQSPSHQTRGESRRKSFRDFKSISRRLFMRASSSKLLQQTSSVSSTATTLPSYQESMCSSSGGIATTGGHMGASKQISGISSQQPPPSRRRNLLKIKRSETVNESSSSHHQHQHHQSPQSITSSTQALNKQFGG